MRKRNPKPSGLTKKDIEFFASGIPGSYFVKKIGSGKYRVSADRARTLRLLHDALGSRFKTIAAPSVMNMWFIVESKQRHNPTLRRASTKRILRAWMRATSGKGSMNLNRKAARRMGLKASMFIRKNGRRK